MMSSGGYSYQFPGRCNDSWSAEVEMLVLLASATEEDEDALPAALLCNDSCSSEDELLVLLAFATGELLVLLAFATGRDESMLPVALFCNDS